MIMKLCRIISLLLAQAEATQRLQQQVSELSAAVQKLQRSVDQILDAGKPGTAKSISFQFEQLTPTGGKQMLSAPLNTKNEKVFIIGKDDSTPPISGAPLAEGQTVTLTSADPSVVDFTMDSSPSVDAEGVQSVASAAVNFKSVGGPVTVTCTVNNADGSVAESQDDLVTITAPVPGVAKSIGVLWEGGVSGSAGV